MSQIGFPVMMAEDLRLMDPRLFRKARMGLADAFRQRRRPTDSERSCHS